MAGGAEPSGHHVLMVYRRGQRRASPVTPRDPPLGACPGPDFELVTAERWAARTVRPDGAIVASRFARPQTAQSGVVRRPHRLDAPPPWIAPAPPPESHNGPREPSGLGAGVDAPGEPPRRPATSVGQALRGPHDRTDPPACRPPPVSAVAADLLEPGRVSFGRLGLVVGRLGVSRRRDWQDKCNECRHSSDGASPLRCRVPGERPLVLQAD
jgi:hypothetical protein